MAENRRDFQRLARMRLKDARVLIQSGNLEAAYYLTGLAVECAVKACIAKNTRRNDFPPNPQAIRDIYSHDLSKLIVAANLQMALDADRRKNAALDNKWTLVIKNWKRQQPIQGWWPECERFVSGGGRQKRSDAVATATLVSSDIEMGRRIVATLTRANIPVTIYLWAFATEPEEWQFIIATPLVDSKGPLAAYREVNNILRKEGLFGDVPLRRISLRSPNDRLLKLLQKESRAVPQETFRVVNDQIAGSFIEDAYLYTGSIDIIRLENSRGVARDKYSVIYLPYSGGGAVPSRRIDGLENLKEFLESNLLHLRKEAADLALKELSETGSASIPNVQLKTQELRRLGLL